MSKPIKVLATHYGPHLDEIAAIWLLRKFGTEEFTGVETAEIKYWDKTDIKQTPEDYEAQGTILLGIGRGKFDEHPDVKKERKEDECCATLVAKHLGIDEEPALKEILEFVKKSDLKMVTDPFNPSVVIKDFHREHPDNPEKAIEWAIVMLEVKYRKQKRFLVETKKEFDEKAQIEDVEINEKTLKLVTIVSDDSQISSLARSKSGCEAAVIIQKSSRGNVQIFPNRKYGISFYDVAQMIRLEEQEVKRQMITTDWEELAKEGKVEGAEEWFFHKEGQFLLNGSSTAPNIPPTQISLERIIELVKIGVNRNQFHKSCDFKRCKSCPWYSWGLHRCRKLRFRQYNS